MAAAPAIYSAAKHYMSGSQSAGRRVVPINNRFTQRLRQSVGGNETAPVSQYHESKLIYRRKKISKFKKARIRRFKKRFIKNSLILVAPNFYTHRFAETGTALATTTVNQQVWSSCGLYTNNWDVALATNQISTDIPTVFINHFATLGVADESRLIFKTAVMEITLENTGSNAVWADAYYLQCRKDVKSNVVNTDHVYRPENLLDHFLSEQGALGTATAVDKDNKGTTPYMCENFCKSFLITKVRRFQIAVGQCINLTVKDHKTRMINGQDVRHRSTNVKGLTQWVMFRFHGCPDPANLPNNKPVTVTIGHDKTYIYKEFQKSGNASGYKL